MSLRSRAPWLPASSLLLALAGGGGACLLPSAAQAYGLSGSFAPANWTLNSYEGVSFPPTPGAGVAPPGTGVPTSPGTSQGYPAYQCADPDSVNCVDILNPSAANFVVRGSDASGNGSVSQPWSTQWEAAYADPGSKTLSFEWTYISTDVSSADQAFYYIDKGGFSYDTFILGSNSGDTGNTSVTLQQGWKLGFGVFTQTNDGTPGYLSVSGFDPSPVPAPLPLLGAGAAFGWSRRLRQRIHHSSGLPSR